MVTSQEISSVVRAILFAESREVWRGVVATPPASLLEVVLAEFLRATPVAAELPFMSTICLVAQYLCEKGAALVMEDGRKVQPDFYTVLLAPSGEMKSFSQSRVLEGFELGGWKPSRIRDAGSTAGLMEELRANEGKATFWWIEEFGQFWKQTVSEAHQGTPRLLLMAYDHATLTKCLRDSVLEVKDPCLSLLGTTVFANLHNQLTKEDWASGLCQRIAFVFCSPDPTRNCFDRRYAILDGVSLEKIANAFRKATETPVHTNYRFTADARSAIGDSWVLMGRQGISADFVRRIEFRAFKYALVYHWLLGKANNEIDKEDVNWAVRLAMLHLSDLRRIMDDVEYAELQDLMRRAEGLRLKFGKELAPRHLLMYLHRQLKTMPAAEALYSLLLDKEKAALAGGKASPLLSDCAVAITVANNTAASPTGNAPPGDARRPTWGAG
jgi:hypothetical protein